MNVKFSYHIAIDSRTGEQLEHERYRDCNFFKVDLRGLAAIVEQLSPAEIQVCCYLLRQLNRCNAVSFSYKMLEQELNLSHASVCKAVRELRKADLIRKQSASVYLVNPEILFNGSSDQRAICCKQYAQCKNGGKTE